MKLGVWHVNPSAVIAATIYPPIGEPRMVKLYVMGLPEPIEIASDHSTPAQMQDAKEFVQRLEATWGDGTPLFAASTARDDYAIDKEIMEALNHDRQTERH